MTTPPNLAIDTLSDRERTVVDLAAQGLTDAQIAQHLAISLSTVNSYWVRIRSKLGSHSRTDLVARLLRHELRVQTAEVRAENFRLREELQAQIERYHDLLAARAAVLDREDCDPALALLPHGVLVVGPPARVQYANRAALRLYAAGAEGMEGLSLDELTVGGTHEPCRAMLDPDGPKTEAHGLEEPYYARRRDGTNFRAVLLAQRYEGASGRLATVSVREFMEDGDWALQDLRKPLVTA